MSNITFEQMLKEYKPKHRVEQLMIISEFSCGCITTLTYGGRPHLFNAKKYFWHTDDECTHGHKTIDFDEANEIANAIGAVNLACEIKVGNSMQVSRELSQKIKMAS